MTNASTDQFCSHCDKWARADFACSVDCTSCFDCCEHLTCISCRDSCATNGDYCSTCKPVETKLPCDHVVYDCKAGFFCCEHCLCELHINLPMEVSEVSKISRDFLAGHRDCKPRETVDNDRFGPKFMEFIQQNLVGALSVLKDRSLSVEMESEMESAFGHLSFNLSLTTGRPE